MNRMLGVSSTVLVTLTLFATTCLGLSTRCFVCNSRGELGDCRDPFTHNATSFKGIPGNPVQIASCPSGWCRKQMELVKGKVEDYGVSIQRHCLQIPPPDGEERCAKVTLGNKPTQLCFCRGDLCNSAQRLQSSSTSSLLILSVSSLMLIYSANAFLSTSLN